MKRKTHLLVGIIGIILLFFMHYSMKVQAVESASSETMEGTTYTTENDSEKQQEIINDYYENFNDGIEVEGLEDEVKAVSRKYGKEKTISLKKIYAFLLEGRVDEAMELALQGFFENIGNEISDNRELLVKLIILVIVAAIFYNYSSIIKFSYVGEQGFYITYLMIAVLLMQSFSIVYDIAEETIYYINDVMKCLLPAFYMSVVLCSGLTTSQMVNSMFLWMLSFIEKILLHIVLPGIRIYFLIVILNQINTKDRFSKLAVLIKQGIQFILKAVVTGIIGLNIMKSMLVPVYDNAKYNIFQKGLSVIPGGMSLSGLSTILLGAGVLIKNSVGITAVIILLILGSVPLLKMLCFLIVYKVILTLIQPISDNRILTGIQGTADSMGIMLRAAATSVVLSVLSIAIVILTTNVRLYSG